MESKSCAITQNASEVLTCDAEYFTPFVFNNTTKLLFKIRSMAMLPVCILAAILNLLVFISIFKQRRMREQSLNRYLLTLTAVDFMSALTALPMYIHYNLSLSAGHFCCHIGNILMMAACAFTMMSITTISVVNLQLYLAILKPFLYSSIFNQQYAFSTLLSINLFWGLSTITTIYLLPKWWNSFRIIASGFAFLSYIIISILHYFICQESRNIRERSKSNATLACNRITQKTLRLTTLVLITFGLCYLPFSTASFYTMVVPITPAFNTYFDTWAEHCALTNCVLNPILYCMRLGSVRRSILRMFCNKDYGGENSVSMNTITVKVSSVPVSESVTQ